ncbi:hypothetical protein ACWCPX_33090 [Streptomyces olivaceoviridis]
MHALLSAAASAVLGTTTAKASAAPGEKPLHARPNITRRRRSPRPQMVLDLADDAFSMPPAAGSGAAHGARGGHGGMQLASAGGAGGSSGDSGKTTKIDHVEFEDGAGKVSRHGDELHLAANSPLRRARGAFGRSKGRDPFTQIFDTVLHGALMRGRIPAEVRHAWEQARKSD